MREVNQPKRSGSSNVIDISYRPPADEVRWCQCSYTQQRSFLEAEQTHDMIYRCHQWEGVPLHVRSSLNINTVDQHSLGSCDPVFTAFMVGFKKWWWIYDTWRRVNQNNIILIPMATRKSSMITHRILKLLHSGLRLALITGRIETS